jgi:hypothetical protein
MEAGGSVTLAAGMAALIINVGSGGFGVVASERDLSGVGDFLVARVDFTREQALEILKCRVFRRWMIRGQVFW